MRGVGITERDPHEEAVELRFGQPERAELLEGILRGDHEERIGQAIGGHVDADLALFHGLEQRALGLGARAVHLVREQQLREHRPLAGTRNRRWRIEHRHADDVGRQQVAGELHALPGQAEHLRQRMRERGLAHAGNVFDQQVAAREQTGEREPHGLRLAEDDAVEGGQGACERGIGGSGHGATIYRARLRPMTRLQFPPSLRTRASCAARLAFCASSSATRARSAATTSGGALRTKFSLPSLALSLAMSDSFFAMRFAQTLDLGFRVDQARPSARAT